MAHEAALAAGQHWKFWEMHDLLFQKPQAKHSDLLAMAKSLQLDVRRFEIALEERTFRNEVMMNITEARGMGVKVTPTIFLNGQKLEGIEQIKSFVDMVLNPPQDTSDPNKISSSTARATRATRRRPPISSSPFWAATPAARSGAPDQSTRPEHQLRTSTSSAPSKTSGTSTGVANQPPKPLAAARLPFLCRSKLRLDDDTFDLPADAASLPLTISPTPTPIAELTLPASGLGFTVLVEYSPDLDTAFEPLPDENFLSGTDSLDAGQTAPVTLSFPAGERGFLRFYVEL